MKKLLPETFVLCAILLVVGYGFAQTWRQTSAPCFAPFSIALSADGRIIVALGSGAPPDISTNYGATWTTNGPVYGVGIASSADGTRLLGAFLRGVFISTNSGATWSQTSLTATGSGYGNPCAASADGTKLAVAAVSTGGYSSAYLIYTSTNSGTSWQTHNPPGGNLSLATTADGAKLFAASYNGYIYLSTNWGQTWSQTSAASSSWRAIATSANGKYLLATGDAGYGGTAISTNSGSSWMPLNIIGYSAACSADGSKQIIGGAEIYTSTNYGMNWASTNIPSTGVWCCVASSADGEELVAAQSWNGSPNRGLIWVRQATPAPLIRVTPRNDSVALSWIVPSTNFVLQRNSDLTTANWTDVSNPPVLSLTHLHDEVTLPLTNGSGFYRLKTP